MYTTFNLDTENNRLLHFFVLGMVFEHGVAKYVLCNDHYLSNTQHNERN